MNEEGSHDQDEWPSSREADIISKTILDRLRIATSGLSDEVKDLLDRYRLINQRLFLENVGEPLAAEGIHKRLWAVHSDVNGFLRKHLKKCTIHERQKSVERRKAEKEYLKFIKGAQSFYRELIRSLTSQHCHIGPLQTIANRLLVDSKAETQKPHLGDGVANEAASANDEQRECILQCCHKAIICLGDLSRWRETELAAPGKRNWDPAVRYYNLANAIRPQSGTPHNQLAVIARLEGDQMSAVYHWHRALVTAEPDGNAGYNLEAELSKIQKSPLHPLCPVVGSSHPARATFLLLVALNQCGIDDDRRPEAEANLLHHIDHCCREDRLEEEHLDKMVLIAIAAEHLSRKRLTVTENPISACFNSLARSPSLAPVDTTLNLPNAVTKALISFIPLLRNLSTYILINVLHLQARRSTALEHKLLSRLWTRYAECLSRLMQTFPITSLGDNMPYLLPEDEDILGFEPLQTRKTRARYLDANGSGSLKPRRDDFGVKRRGPSEEMLARVRGLLEDGVALHLEEGVPIELDETGTIFRYTGFNDS